MSSLLAVPQSAADLSSEAKISEKPKSELMTAEGARGNPEASSKVTTSITLQPATGDHFSLV